jgi:hypothetical protein
VAEKNQTKQYVTHCGVVGTSFAHVFFVGNNFYESRSVRKNNSMKNTDVHGGYLNEYR